DDVHQQDRTSNENRQRRQGDQRVVLLNRNDCNPIRATRFARSKQFTPPRNVSRRRLSCAFPSIFRLPTQEQAKQCGDADDDRRDDEHPNHATVFGKLPKTQNLAGSTSQAIKKRRRRIIRRGALIGIFLLGAAFGLR
ncbi:MAG: hypothetical protein N2C14_25150, partial [Planctomycetales bacterium]